MNLLLTNIPGLGDYALSGAMLTAVGALVAGLAYRRLEDARLIRVMRWAQGLLLVLLGLASWQLVAALIGDNFHLNYVAAHSEKNLGTGYKIAAFWAGQEGSMLLWALMLAVMGVLMAWRLRKVNNGFTAIALGVMSAATGFFTCVMLFAQHGNPFAPAEKGTVSGMGLNPALQNLAMVFHPPMLFLGYAGFTAPFAYMVAGLLTDRRQDKLWLQLARPWMVYSWITLTVGILLGAQWAYMELGWGGYWAWDPVENASLLPWLTGTALLHTVILQQRRGMFKQWTAWLTAASFFLCILGTYLTRSGVIESVHAFEQSDIGYYFLAFMGLVVVSSIALIGIATVKGRLTAEHALEAIVSREGMFLVASVLLVIMTATVGVGTLYPLISGVFGTRVTVNGPFYNSVVLPMGLLLAALMATGPVLGSGAGALERARGKLGGMFIAGAASAALVFVLGYMSPWALATAAAIGAVLAALAIDVSASVRTGQGVLKAITVRYRHWGAQLAHLGLALLVAGVAGSSLYGQSRTIQLHPTDSPANKRDRALDGYVLSLGGMNEERRANHTAVVATVNLTDPNGKKFTLRPERRFYDQDPQNGATVVALKPGVFSDVYLTLAGAEQDGSTVSITTLINPLVNWIWAGGILLTLGGLVCLIPSRSAVGRLPAASEHNDPENDRALVPATAGEPYMRRGKTKRERERALTFNQIDVLPGRR